MDDGQIRYNLKSFVYDLNGNLIAEISSDEYVSVSGNPINTDTITYTYDDNNRLWTVEDSSGAYIKYCYNSLNQVTEEKILMLDGQYMIKGYDYDSLGNLLKQWVTLEAEDLSGVYQEPTKSEWNYTYDKNGNVLTQTSPLGATTSYEYYENDLLKSVKQYVSEQWFDMAKAKMTIYSPMLKFYNNQVYTFDLLANTEEVMRDVSLSISYDTRFASYVSNENPIAGLNVSEPTPGILQITGTDVDIVGDVTLLSLDFKMSQDSLGVGYIVINEESTYNDENGQEQSFTEVRGRNVEVAQPDMNLDGKVLANDLTMAALVNGKSTLDEAYYPLYDVNGNGQIETNDYEFISSWILQNISETKSHLQSEVFNQIIRHPQYNQGENLIEITTTYEYDAYGNILSIIDDNGDITRYTYNELQQLVKVMDKDGNSTRYFYDENGNVVKVIMPENYSESSDNGLGKSYEYDLQNRLIKVTDEANVVVQKNLYDLNGNLYKSMDGDNYITGLSDDTRDGTLYKYDIGGRLIGVQTPESLKLGEYVLQVEYDSKDNVISEIDGIGNETTYTLDMWGRKLDVYYPESRTEHYTYDYLGNVLSSKDGNGNITNYSYNAFNQLQRITDPKGQSINYKYDLEGRLAEEIDRKGQHTYYEYNERGLLIDRNIDNDASTQVNYFYNKDSELVGVISPTMYEVYDYTNSGQLASKSRNDEFTVSFEYNKNGNLSSIISPDGTSVGYQYDVVGRLQEVSGIQTGSIEFDYTYGNKLNHTYYGSGVTMNNNYDDDGRIIEEIYTNSDDEIINSTQYAYYNNGNIKSQEINGDLTSYFYDGLGQIESAVYPDQLLESFTYDLAGNRLSQTTNGNVNNYSYNELNQLVSSVLSGIETYYSYDLNGNMTEVISNDEAIYYGYNKWDQLTNVSLNDGQWAQYEYDTMDLRSSVTYNGVYTEYVTDGWNNIAELDINSNTSRRNVWTDRLVYSEDIFENGYEYLSNYHNDITGIMSEQGVIVNSYQYDVYGNIRSEQELIGNPYKYAGEILDPISDLYYLRSRYYNPDIGKFTQEDTYRGDGLNLYSYVSNNPVMYIDQSGHEKNSTFSSGFSNGFKSFFTNEYNSIKNEVVDLFTNPIVATIENTKSKYSDPDTFISLTLGCGGLFDVRPIAKAKELTNLTSMIKKDDRYGLGNYAGNIAGGVAQDLVLFAVTEGVSKVKSSVGTKTINGVKNSKTLYRGERSTVTPEQVFDKGFNPKGTGDDLLAHTRSNSTPGNYVSTTSEIDIAAEGFAGKNGYVYKIETSNYINVNETLGKSTLFPEQVEFSIPGGVSPHEIVGAYPKKGGKLTGEFISNPNYWRFK